MDYLGNGYYKMDIDGTTHRFAFEISNFKGGKAWRRVVDPSQMKAVAGLVEAAFRAQDAQFLGAASKGISVKEMTEGGAPTKIDVWGPGGTTQGDETTKRAMGQIIGMLKNNPIGNDSLKPRRARMRRSGSTSSVSGSSSPLLRRRRSSVDLSEDEDDSASCSSSPLMMSKKRWGKMRKGTKVTDLVRNIEVERDELREEVEALEKQQRRVQQRLEKLEKENKKMAALRQQNQGLEKAIKGKKAEVSRLGKEVKCLKKVNGVANKKVREQAKVIKKQKAEIAKLEKEIEELPAIDLEELEKELASVEVERVVQKNRVGGTLVLEKGTKHAGPRVRQRKVRLVERVTSADNIPARTGKKVSESLPVGYAEIDHSLELEVENADLRMENEKQRLKMEEMALEIERLKQERMKEVAVSASIPAVVERTRYVETPVVRGAPVHPLKHGVDSVERAEARTGVSEAVVVAPVMVERDEAIETRVVLEPAVEPLDNSEEVAKLKKRIADLEFELYNGLDGDDVSFDDEVVDDPRIEQLAKLERELEEATLANATLVDEKAALLRKNAALTLDLRKAGTALEKVEGKLGRERTARLQAEETKELAVADNEEMLKRHSELSEKLEAAEKNVVRLGKELARAKEWKEEANTAEEHARLMESERDEARVEVRKANKRNEVLDSKLEGFLEENRELSEGAASVSRLEKQLELARKEAEHLRHEAEESNEILTRMKLILEEDPVLMNRLVEAFEEN